LKTGGNILSWLGANLGESGRNGFCGIIEEENNIYSNNMAGCKETGERYWQLKDKYEFFTGNVESARKNPEMREELFAAAQTGLSLAAEIRKNLLGFYEKQLLDLKIKPHQMNDLFASILKKNTVDISWGSGLGRGTPKAVSVYIQKITNPVILEKIKMSPTLFNNRTRIYKFHENISKYSQLGASEFAGAFVSADMIIGGDDDTGAELKAHIYLRAYYDRRLPAKIIINISVRNSKARPLNKGETCAYCDGGGCWKCNFQGEN
jgi:hypothetical protein